MDCGNRRDARAPEPIGSRTEGGRGGARHVQDAVGRLLRSHYRDLVETPLPEDLSRLIARLDARERGKT